MIGKRIIIAVKFETSTKEVTLCWLTGFSAPKSLISRDEQVGARKMFSHALMHFIEKIFNI